MKQGLFDVKIFKVFLSRCKIMSISWSGFWQKSSTD